MNTLTKSSAKNWLDYLTPSKYGTGAQQSDSDEDYEEEDSDDQPVVSKSKYTNRK